MSQNTYDTDLFRKMARCLPFADADAGIVETQQAMMEAAAEIDRLHAANSELTEACRAALGELTPGTRVACFTTAQREQERVIGLLRAVLSKAARQSGERAGDGPWVRLEVRNTEGSGQFAWDVVAETGVVADSLTESEARALADAYNAHANPAAVGAVIEAAREMDAELRLLAAQGNAREKPRLDIVDRLARSLARLGPDTKGTPDDTH